MKKITEVTFNKTKDSKGKVIPYGWMSNMSDFSVIHEGVWYSNTETLFQCLRFQDFPKITEELRSLKSPMIVKMKAKKHLKILTNQYGFKIDKNEDLERMRLCLRLKINRHLNLKRLLVVTRDATIIEDCTTRRKGSGSYWGACCVDGKWIGENVLGRLWMELREEVKSEFDLPVKTPYFVAWNENLKPKIDLPKQSKLSAAA